MINCQMCKVAQCIETEFLCAACLILRQQALSVHQQKVVDQEQLALDQEVEEHWTHFISQHPHLEKFSNVEYDDVKNHKQRKEMGNFCRGYSVKNNNNGKGLLFVGKARMLAIYILKKIMKKHFESDGVVSFDYANVNDCISKVFASPTENFYSTSTLLLMDSIDLESILDNKYQTNAFIAFLKYRLSTHRPTFMVVNFVTRECKALNDCIDSVFGNVKIIG